MPLQDLTPQLRTRLSRVEKAVGWFVLLAGLLLVTGFVYFLWHTAQRKGWFVQKVPFCTCLNTATGVKPGDPVKMMGFNIGEVTRVIPNEPSAYYNVTIYFEIRHDTNGYVGYVWNDSKVRITAADFLGSRALEIVKGREGIPIFSVIKSEQDPSGVIQGILNLNFLKALQKEGKDPLASFKINPNPFYLPYTNATPWYVEPDESPALTERLEQVLGQAEKALPNLLGLTNRINQVLDNAILLTSNLNLAVHETRPTLTNAQVMLADVDRLVKDLGPIITNVQQITTRLKDPNGSLGDWLFPTNLKAQVEFTLAHANQSVAQNQTNIDFLVGSINRTLDNLAGITGNLNRQVNANTNVVADVSNLIHDTDLLVQSLRNHWFFRSAFKATTNQAAAKPTAKGVKKK